MTSHGQNVWFELMTTDIEAAKRFYSEVVGWSSETMVVPGNESKDPYVMWTVGQRPIGGLIALPEEAKQKGAPPHWLAYTAVDDVDATCVRAEELGAKIHKAPFDIPSVGRIAILADPQGATFAIFKPEEEMPQTDARGVGDFSWAELNTSDYEAAWRFYSELFRWRHTESVEMGPSGTYFMFSDVDKVTLGGMCSAAEKTGAPPQWLYYVSVDEIDAALQRVTQQGGSVSNGPMVVPGGGKVAQCEDAQGVPFALYAEKTGGGESL